MADVFINYRTDDGDAASRLEDWLKKEFDVFIDTGLRAGDDIESAIMESLAEARVVLAVIGKQWMSQGSLDRLQSPDDWIRRELIAAWKRADCKVLPVRLGTAPMPTTAQLPKDMLRLLSTKAFPLQRDTWEADIGALMKEISDCLQSAPPPKKTAVVPNELPYLCDRVVQEADLTRLVRAAQSTRSLVCMLDGYKLEEHDGCIKRLQHRRVLEDLFSVGSANVEIRRLQWNRPLAEAGQYDEVLSDLIKSDILHKRIATDEEMREFLRNPAGPIVVMLEVNASDLADCEGLLPGLQNAWQSLVASLGTTPAHFLALWFNVVYEKEGERLLPASSGVPHLTPLSPVKLADINEWMRMNEVAEFVVGHDTEIAALVTDPQFYATPGKIHMRRFADAVGNLITAD